MLRNWLYYHVKPFLPAAVRLSVRRWFALRKRPRVGDVWPVLPGSERPPQDWRGWPGGKQFALVLTHDVESHIGLARCHKLMRLEMSMGFRSSFNFIPEGDYRVPRSLVEGIRRNDFEIGVHDLHHDGKLYSSRAEFARKALKINQHLKNWGAVGFRSGFMLRRLDWLHDLEVHYDSSTFDTDPFEPQPDGAGTIFPFWVPRSAHGAASRPPRTDGHSPGYVELPYTLAQDSTLFLLLRETTIEAWKRKLDWIVENGGMALLNVHPDYMSFSPLANGLPSYPVGFYEELLSYVKSRYGGVCWHALPRDVARFWNDQKFARPVASGRRVCMVSYSFYESDNRVIRYAEALAQRGDDVEALALARGPADRPRETIGQVCLSRIQSRSQKNQKSKAAFLLPLVRFWLNASIRLAWRHLWRRYDVIHVHNVPDFLVFAAWFPKLTGAKVILDIHDIVPEFYASKFSLSAGSLGVRMLKRVEKASAWFADRVIISNHLWLDTFASRTGARDKCSVFINNVDSSLFRPRPKKRDDGKPIVIFPGGLQRHQGLDICIRAFQKVIRELPHAEFHIYGDGNMKSCWMKLAADLGLDNHVRFFNPVPARQIADVMANADLGVVPKRADSFGNEAYSTKIMEFMSLGIPVVVSNTKIDQYYFDDSVVRFFESGNPDALAEAMLEVLGNRDLRQQMLAAASRYVTLNSWETRRGEYFELVDALAGARRPADPGAPPAPPSARGPAALPPEPVRGSRELASLDNRNLASPR
jgi:glycosyltransferase involved in cell wall biosynthesis